MNTRRALLLMFLATVLVSGVAYGADGGTRSAAARKVIIDQDAFGTTGSNMRG